MAKPLSASISNDSIGLSDVLQFDYEPIVSIDHVDNITAKSFISYFDNYIKSENITKVQKI
jgi:hypothetical protein